MTVAARWIRAGCIPLPRPGATTSLAAGAFGTQALLLVAGVLAARLLGPADRGMLAVAILWPSVAYGAVEFGIQTVCASLPAERAGDGELIASGLVVAAVQASIAVPVALVGLGLAGVAPDSAIPATFLVLALAVRGPFLGLQRAQHRLKAFAVARFAQVAGYTAAVTLLTALGERSVSLFVTAYVAAMALSAAMAAIDVLPGIRGSRRPNRRILQHFWRTGRWAHAGNLASGDAFSIDNVIASAALSAPELGLYVAARAFMNLPVLLGQSLAAATGGATATSHQLMRTMLVSAAWIGLTGIAMGAIVPFAVPLLLGDEFKGAGVVAIALVGSSTLMATRRIATEALRLKSHFRQPTVADLIGLAVFVATATSIHAGPLGVAESLLIGHLVATVITYGFLIRTWR